MKRSALVTVPLLMWVSACAAPTGVDQPLAKAGRASPNPDVLGAPPKKTPRPTLVISVACVTAGNAMHLVMPWSDEIIIINTALIFNVVFKGPQGLAYPVQQDFPVPLNVSDPTDFATMDVDPDITAFPTPPRPWSDYTAIAASANGYFNDTAPTIHQPKTGWPACP